MAQSEKSSASVELAKIRALQGLVRDIETIEASLYNVKQKLERLSWLILRPDLADSMAPLNEPQVAEEAPETDDPMCGLD